MKRFLIGLLEKLYGWLKVKKFRYVILVLVAKLDGGMFWSQAVRDIYSNYHNIKIGYGTYGGAFDVDSIREGTTFGRYCSIAQGVKIFNANHPKQDFTMHPIFYNKDLGYVKKDKLCRTVLNVGNDVWIGADVIILPSVSSIGDGAIIGAGSVVTKNVDAYDIVAGNPAIVKGKRFSDEVIRKLQNSRWWELDKDILLEKRDELAALVSGNINV